MPATPNIFLDYDLESALGNMSHSGEPDGPIYRIGQNPSVTTSFQGVWSEGGPFNFLTAPETVCIRAGGNVNDDSSGTGAREIVVVGLNSNFDVTAETIVTNGASVSLETTTQFMRVFDVRVTKVGTYGASNAGDMFIETSDTNTLISKIILGVGQSQLAQAFAARNRALILRGFSVYVEGVKNIDLRIMLRDRFDITTGDMGPTKRLFFAQDIGGIIHEVFETPLRIPPLSEIYVEAATKSGTSSVTAILYMVFASEKE